MLTLIKYGDADHENIIEATFDDFSVEVVDERLLFRFNIFVDIEIKDQHVISFLFEDDEAFFSFVVDDVEIVSENLFYEKNLYLFSAAVLFGFEPFEKTQMPIETNEQTIAKEDVVMADEEIKREDSSTQENLLLETIEKLKSLFQEAADDKKPLTYLLILLFAYIYGVVHAIGPGHGKTLVASYFLSNDRSYTKALLISLAIGVVHTFSAFFLTLVIYFLIETFLAQFMQDTIAITTKISAFVIIAIALHLFYKKYRSYRAKKHASSCGCGSCKVDSNSTDLALIVSAGIIPCPGTVTIFIFSLSMGMYFLGFLSAFVMSLGMSSIIFLSAIISVTLRKKTSQKHTKIQIILEYLSLVLIFILGVVLFFSAY
jgi:ABC-type nickel/cobalt efflux system permease component RcnA